MGCSAAQEYVYHQQIRPATVIAAVTQELVSETVLQLVHYLIRTSEVRVGRIMLNELELDRGDGRLITNVKI
jgi:hypothetical protein